MNPIYSEDAEFAVISSSLMDDSVVPGMLSILTEDDFYNPAYRILFKAIKALNGLGRKIDIVTVLDFLRREQTLDVIGGAANVAMFIRGTTNAENILWYANMVKEKALKREVLKRANYIQSNPESDKVETWVDEMVELAQAVPCGVKTTVSLKDLLDTEMVLEGYETKFTKLDELLIKIHKQEYFVIAGRPSYGKSAFALNLAVNFAKQEIPVIFFSLEMGSYFLKSRIIASESRIACRKIIYNRLNNPEEEHYNETKNRIENLPIFFETNPEMSIKEIDKTIRNFKIKHDDFIPIIDYIQLVGTGRGRTREEEVAEISRWIKRLAMDLNIPIIALSQLSRKVDNRGKEAEPILSDLRESGAIEQDADIVLFLHRDSKAVHSEEDTESIKFLLQKRRNGATGKVLLTFHKSYTRFDNYIEMPYIPQEVL